MLLSAYALAGRLQICNDGTLQYWYGGMSLILNDLRTNETSLNKECNRTLQARPMPTHKIVIENIIELSQLTKL
jgi:hypothetical protein